jgi:hypothetical protein
MMLKRVPAILRLGIPRLPPGVLRALRHRVGSGLNGRRGVIGEGSLESHMMTSLSLNGGEIGDVVSGVSLLQ